MKTILFNLSAIFLHMRLPCFMNRIGYILVLSASLLTTASCKWFKPGHPQARMHQMDVNTLTEQNIRDYADSIDLNISLFNKETSLVYEQGDYSFSVTRYSFNGSPVLYVEQGDGGDYGYTASRYYLIDGKPVLSTVETKSLATSPQFKSARQFYRNNILFYSDHKSSDDSLTFIKTAFKKADKLQAEDPLQKISLYEDALAQKGKFALVFEGITEYPGARYIVLGQPGINSYSAAIKVLKEDDLIRELVSDPGKHKGEKIKIKYEVRSKREVVYLSGTL